MARQGKSGAQQCRGGSGVFTYKGSGQPLIEVAYALRGFKDAPFGFEHILIRV